MPATILHFETALLPGGWASNVGIRMGGGVIREVVCDVDAAPEAERHKIGLPGMPNVHSHAFQRGFAGLAERRARESQQVGMAQGYGEPGGLNSWMATP